MSYKVTNDIYMTDKHLYVIKVNQEIFCVVNSKDQLEHLLTSITDTLVKELQDNSDVKSGWTKITKEITQTAIVISSQQLGRLINGSKIPVYTVTYTTVAESVVKEPKEEDIPRYAEIHVIRNPVPRQTIRSIMPIKEHEIMLARARLRHVQ